MRLLTWHYLSRRHFRWPYALIGEQNDNAVPFSEVQRCGCGCLMGHLRRHPLP